MKKSLLFVALLAGAMGASAQEYCAFDTECGLTSTKTTTAGGTQVGASDNVTMYLAYEDSWGTTSTAYAVSGTYDTVVLNGSSYTVGTGFTGNTNPTGSSLDPEAISAATAGAVVQFDVKADGYLTVIGKLSSNKPYYVWEGLAGKGESALAYTLAMDWGSGAKAGASCSTIVYTVPADEDGYVDFDASDISTYISGTAYKWPEKIVLGDDAADIKTNGVGIITFPVYADAESYLVHATGSKITTCGAVFTTSPITSAYLTGTDADGNAQSVVLIGDATGITEVTASAATSTAAPVYNLAGQQVSKDVKGILIQNGRKFVNK